jgi:hypothetical protein
LLAPPTQEDVRHGFRFILGREPEDEAAIEAHMRVAIVAELREILLSSDEFSGKFKFMYPDASEHPIASIDRRTIVFIHLQKTGGTSLRSMLGKQFPDERKCPVFEDKLHLLSIAELAQYDFFRVTSIFLRYASFLAMTSKRSPCFASPEPGSFPSTAS